jgi:hypothetical protein
MRLVQKIGQASSAAGIELQFYRLAFIGVIAKAHQRSGACETVKRLWSPLGAGERYYKTGCGVAIGCTAYQPRDRQQRDCDEASSHIPSAFISVENTTMLIDRYRIL